MKWGGVCEGWDELNKLNFRIFENHFQGASGLLVSDGEHYDG